MKILIAASDLTPLISADPLRRASAVASLPVALQRAGHEVSVIGPLLPALANAAPLKLKATGVQINVALGHGRETVQVFEAKSEDGLQLFLFRHDDTFGQMAEEPPAFHANARAAVLFSKLIIELSRRLNPAPDILHVQDWPGTLAPVFLRAQNLPFASVLAVSDPTAQGSFPIEDFGLLNLGWEYFRPTAVEFYGRVNFLKAGLLTAHAVVAPGDLERGALQTPEYGGGLDVVFREQAARLHGIPDGLDENTWNPARDPFVAKRYQSSNLGGKPTCRNVLLSHLGLDKNPAGPVYLLDFAAGQDKLYIDLLAARLDQLLADDVRLVVLGAFPAGSPAEIKFQITARKYPTRLALAAAVDDRLTHLALSGADFQLFLGRTLHLSDDILRSLKYGTVPIAPAGPGITQLIADFQPGVDGGNGVLFYRPSGEALFDALAHRAAALLRPADDWEALQQQAMIHAGKFTWARTAAQYVALYQRLKP